MSTFVTALESGPIVLDGGLGTLLESRGHDLTSSLWSARLLAEEPDAIRAAHAEFFAVGARVAITSSYQVSFSGLEAAGYSGEDVRALLRSSVDLAREAREEAGLTADEAWVAASVGPYGASLADGSEYTGRYDVGLAQLRAWHRPRLLELASAAPDAIAIETIPSMAELEALSREVEGLGVPVWLSVTIADGRLRSGESLTEAFALASDVPEIVAIGVNCCDTAEVRGALDVLAARRPGVVYPNSGEVWHADEREWAGAASPVAAHVAEWVGRGAGLVGGCCRVGPDQIAAIASAVASLGADSGRHDGGPA